MRPTFSRIVRRLGLVSLLLFALAPAARAEVGVAADFDGDGRIDRAQLDRREPSLIRVWLSTTGRVTVVRAGAAVSAIVAMDLDGDRKAELVTRGPSTELQVWTKSQKGFRSYRPRRSTTAQTDPHRRSADDSPEPSDPDLSVHTFHAAIQAPSAPRAPGRVFVRAARAELIAPGSGFRFAPSAPRPPPVSLL